MFPGSLLLPNNSDLHLGHPVGCSEPDHWSKILQVLIHQLGAKHQFVQLVHQCLAKRLTAKKLVQILGSTRTTFVPAEITKLYMQMVRAVQEKDTCLQVGIYNDAYKTTRCVSGALGLALCFICYSTCSPAVSIS